MAVETAAPRLRRLPRPSLAVPVPLPGWPALVVGAIALVAATWLAATLAHELLVVTVAVVLPALTALPFIDGAIALLPINYVYAAAMVRYAGQIEPSGIAVGGDAGAWLAATFPGAFYDPAFVAGEGLASAVFAPGSSLLARALATGLINVGLIAFGLGLSLRAARLGHGISTPAGLRGRAALLMAIAVVVQAEVVARVLRTAGATRDLETLGVLPFIFHQVLQLHTDVYDRVTFHAGRLVDPVFSEVVLVGMYGVVIAGWLAFRAARGVPTWLRRPRAARGWVVEGSTPARRASPTRLALDGALLAMLIAALPVIDGAVSESRFLDWEVEQPTAVIPTDVLVLEPSTLDDEVNLPPPIWPQGSTILPVAPAQLAPPPLPAPAPAATASSAAQAGVPVPIAPVIPVAPKIVRASVVAIGGRGNNFVYMVDGTATEFRGMGYNVTHAALPRGERADRLRTDFTLMRDVGVNHVLGWRTNEWDEAVLDAAQAAGIGVVMPFDLDDKLDYSDRSVRNRLRAEILAWVARYRGHPAIRMWGIGNETLLHMKQAARARAFAEFYTGTVELVRQLDPDHPVLYREAEDVYVRWLQEAWKAGSGAPPHGFVLGMNFYTFRMKDALAEWPKKGLDVPIVISEFAPAGVGRGDRPAGYWRMWSLIRSRPELVLGAAPYVWAVDGPEPADRLFGLTDGKGTAVDATLATLKDVYRAPAAAESQPLPPLVGLQLGDAQMLLRSRRIEVAAVEYAQPADLRDPSLHRRYGVGRIVAQEPAPAGKVRLLVAAAPPQLDGPRGRPRPE